MHLRVVTLPDTPDDSPLRSYDFSLDIPLDGYYSYQREYLCMNTLPSNHSDSPFPGLFHADPRDRLLVFTVETLDSLWFTLQTLYVTHATFLSYIAIHPSDADTVSVPWEVWGPRNTHIVNSPLATGLFDQMAISGMHTLIKSVAFREHKKLHIMDYHPKTGRSHPGHARYHPACRGNSNWRRVESFRCDRGATTQYWHTVTHRYPIRFKGHTIPRWTSVRESRMRTRRRRSGATRGQCVPMSTVYMCLHSTST